MTPVLRMLDGAELFDWLRLARSDNVGPRTFLRLLERFGSARAALEALPRLPAGRSVSIASPALVEAELAAAARRGLRFVPLCDPAYPPSLRVIASAPPLLAVQGRPEVLQRSMVAIVGSRNASANGLVFTERLAQGLGHAGHVVVSGLARGIDARAHAATLGTGTVAVLAGGHDRIYPSEHRGLAEKIAESGAVVSEMPIGWEPRGRDFPRRNRIVSGLSLGVVVVEAARRSGSLITARFGNEQGREVFAVPGPPYDLRSEGTNDLLRNGATFCTCAADVTDALAPMLRAQPALTAREPFTEARPEEIYWDELDLDAESVATAGSRTTRIRPAAGDDSRPPEQPPSALSPRDRLSELIGPAAVSIDDLVRASEMPVHVVQAVLVELELDGLIRRQGMNSVARAPGRA
jgi:DNA processing protein